MTRGHERTARAWRSITTRAHAEHAPIKVPIICDTLRTVIGATGVGVLVTGAGTERSEPYYADGPLSRRLAEWQFTLGEGPSLEALTYNGPVLVPDLAAAGPQASWPGFTGEALRAGVAATFTFPLVVGAIRIGVLDLFRDTAGTLTDDQIADCVCFAGIALGVLLDSEAGAPTRIDGYARPDGDSGAGHPAVDGYAHPDGNAHADGRAEVHQATGMISVQLGVTLEIALLRLRAYSFAHDRLLHEVATDVVSRRLRFTS